MGDGESSSAGSGDGSIFGQFFGHLFDMPRWQKLVLTIAGLIGAAGVGGHVTGMMSDDPPKATATARTERDLGAPPRSSVLDARSHVVPEPGGSPPADAGPNLPEDNSAKGILIRNAPWMTRVGIGFVAAFIVGWIFRAFIKLMTMMTIVIVILLAGLSYFRVIDIDFSKAEQQYATASAWVTDQATKVKDAIFAHIPMSMSSTVGMFLGFRRK